MICPTSSAGTFVDTSCPFAYVPRRLLPPILAYQDCSEGLQVLGLRLVLEPGSLGEARRFIERSVRAVHQPGARGRRLSEHYIVLAQHGGRFPECRDRLVFTVGLLCERMCQFRQCFGL